MLWASQQRERLRSEWEQGGLDASLLQEYVVRNATAKGFCNAMYELMNLEANDLEDTNGK